MHPPRLKQKTSRIPLTASAFNNETLHHTALAELFFCWQWVYSYKKRNTNKTLLTCITTEQHFILCFIRTSVQYQHFCRPGKWSLLSGIQAFYREEPCFKHKHSTNQNRDTSSLPRQPSSMQSWFLRSHTFCLEPPRVQPFYNIKEIKGNALHISNHTRGTVTRRGTGVRPSNEPNADRQQHMSDHSLKSVHDWCYTSVKSLHSDRGVIFFIPFLAMCELIALTYWLP